MSNNVPKLETSTDIWHATIELESGRRRAMKELMRDFDERYYKPARKDIQDACAKIGHVWRFTHLGPLGDPWYSCNQCHASECRHEAQSQRAL